MSRAADKLVRPFDLDASGPGVGTADERLLSRDAVLHEFIDPMFYACDRITGGPPAPRTTAAATQSRLSGALAPH